MGTKVCIGIAVLVGAAFFAAGYLAAQNKFGQPKTILHISLIKWKADAPEAEKQKALNGVLEMAARIPGIKNVWIKPKRMQPRDYHTAFVLENLKTERPPFAMRKIRSTRNGPSNSCPSAKPAFLRKSPTEWRRLPADCVGGGSALC